MKRSRTVRSMVCMLLMTVLMTVFLPFFAMTALMTVFFPLCTMTAGPGISPVQNHFCAGSPGAGEIVYAAETETETIAELLFHAEAEQEKTLKAVMQQGSENLQQSESDQQTGSRAEKENEEKYYTVRITDAAPVIPEGGRIYDGTDRMEVTFQTHLEESGERQDGAECGEGEEKEEISDHNNDEKDPGNAEQMPEYEIICNAHLDSADAGARRVLCDFSLQTPETDHVKLDETCVHYEWDAEVLPAPLSVKISDGTKRYGDPADLAHIAFPESQIVTVTGFVKDETGADIIPAGFVLPEADVDAGVLKDKSPMYEISELSNPGPLIEYRDVITLKYREDGTLTGDATMNYFFVTDPADSRYERGSVTITRAEIREGEEFDVEGDTGSFFRFADGSFLVRSGSVLRAKPIRGSGYNCSVSSGKLTGDGRFVFQMKRENDDGKILADSEVCSICCRVDPEAPAAEITEDEIHERNGILISAEEAVYRITVPSDELSGIASVRYRVSRTPLSENSISGQAPGGSEDGHGEWVRIGQTADIRLTEEGVYGIETEVTDGVGNSTVSYGRRIVIDRSPPELGISGVEDGSANAAEVILHLTCTDPTFRTGTLSAELTAAFGGMIPKHRVIKENGSGAEAVFQDFPRKRKADAVYTLTAAAEDLAGNKAKAVITFSVNRFGSACSLGKTTAEAVRTYYHRSAFDVVFTETDLDQVSRARVLLRKGSAIRELKEGDGFQTKTEQTKNGSYRYTYTIPASEFAEDGAYEAVLLTRDRAGNMTDSSRAVPVRFAIDTACPECILTGLEPSGRYRTSRHTAVCEIRDNMAIQKAEVYLDAIPAAVYNAAQLAESGGVIKISLAEKKTWQRIQIHASDQAGNETWTEEIAVYVNTKDHEKAAPYTTSLPSARELAETPSADHGVQNRASGERITQKTGKAYRSGNTGDTAGGTGTVHAQDRDFSLTAGIAVLIAGIAAAVWILFLRKRHCS